MTSSNNRRGGRLVLFDRRIINSFTPPPGERTPGTISLESIARFYVIFCLGRSGDRMSGNRMIIDSFTPLGRSALWAIDFMSELFCALA